MNKPHSPIEKKNQRQKRFKPDVYLRIGELESDLKTNQKRVQFYQYSMTIITPSRPEQVWVSDITYFRTKTGFIYGHLITDGYSKKLVGHPLPSWYSKWL